MPGGRLVIGGLDEAGSDRHADLKLMPRKARRLAREAQRLLDVPPLQVEQCWSGAFGSSDTGLPVIGAVPGLPGCHVVAGFGGNGITHAMLAARMLVAELGGRPLPHSHLYQPVTRPAVA
jgi:glycine/D-amino acid oxidase-like deaminating enzyme